MSSSRLLSNAIRLRPVQRAHVVPPQQVAISQRQLSAPARVQPTHLVWSNEVHEGHRCVICRLGGHMTALDPFRRMVLDNQCDCVAFSGGRLKASEVDVVRRYEVTEARWGRPPARHRVIQCHSSRSFGEAVCSELSLFGMSDMSRSSGSAFRSGGAGPSSLLAAGGERPTSLRAPLLTTTMPPPSHGAQGRSSRCPAQMNGRQVISAPASFRYSSRTKSLAPHIFPKRQHIRTALKASAVVDDLRGTLSFFDVVTSPLAVLSRIGVLICPTHFFSFSPQSPCPR